MISRCLLAITLVLGWPAVTWADDPVSDFLGRWTVVDAHVAPWFDGSGAKPVISGALVSKTLTFEPHAASGVPLVACGDTVYKVSIVGPDYLFEGNLPDPARHAAELGFKGDKIVSLNVGCKSSAGDMELDFPVVDHDTLLLGLDNVIYTLRRVR